MEDTTIIESLRRGDESTFKCIFERHYVLLCRFANQILNNAALSEEVVDDVIFMGALPGNRNHLFYPGLPDALRS